MKNKSRVLLVLLLMLCSFLTLSLKDTKIVSASDHSHTKKSSRETSSSYCYYKCTANDGYYLNGDGTGSWSTSYTGFSHSLSWADGENGERHKHCSKCGRDYESHICANNKGYTYVNDGAHNVYCKKCSKDLGNVSHTYAYAYVDDYNHEVTCSDCEHSFGNKAHTLADNGSDAHKCTDCNTNMKNKQYHHYFNGNSCTLCPTTLTVSLDSDWVEELEPWENYAVFDSIPPWSETEPQEEIDISIDHALWDSPDLGTAKGREVFVTMEAERYRRQDAGRTAGMNMDDEKRFISFSEYATRTQSAENPYYGSGENPDYPSLSSEDLDNYNPWLVREEGTGMVALLSEFLSRTFETYEDLEENNKLDNIINGNLGSNPAIKAAWYGLSGAKAFTHDMGGKTDGSKTQFKIDGLPEGRIRILQLVVKDSDKNPIAAYDVNGGNGRLYFKGSVPPPPHRRYFAYLTVAYRDRDGNKIPGAPADITIPKLCYNDGYVKCIYKGNVNLPLLDSLGWRYLGYKINENSTSIGGKISGVEDLTLQASETLSPQAESYEIEATMRGNKIFKSITFYFDPVQLTVKHVNTSRTDANGNPLEIVTKKNGTYDLPKEIASTNNPDHQCEKLGCVIDIDNPENSVHYNRSMDKISWPGYILQSYDLSTVQGTAIKGKVYNLNDLTPENYENETTRKANQKDKEVLGSNATTLLRRKVIDVPIQVETGHRTGYRHDLNLIFDYQNVFVDVEHNTITNGTPGNLISAYDFAGLQSYFNGGESKYTLQLNGHYMAISSLFLDDEEHILKEVSNDTKYKLPGWILRKATLDQDDGTHVEKVFSYQQQEINPYEVLDATNLQYYVITSNNPEFTALKNLGVNSKIKFYYEKVPMLTIRFVDEQGNKILPTEYLALENETTRAYSKDLTNYGWSFIHYQLDSGDKIENPASVEGMPNVKYVDVPRNGNYDRIIDFVYTQGNPKLNIRYVEKSTFNSNKLNETTDLVAKELKTFESDTLSAQRKDLSNLQVSAEDTRTYKYVGYELYYDGTPTTITSSGVDQIVTVTNERDNRRDRLLVFLYEVNDEIIPEDPTIINTNEQNVILRSNDRGNEEYNVENAIPTSEDLYANVITDSFLLSDVIEQKYDSGDIEVTLIQPYFITNYAEDRSYSEDEEGLKYAVSSSPIRLKMPYSYLSANDVELEVLSRTIVKNDSIAHRNPKTGELIEKDINGNLTKKQVTLTPNNYEEPELIYNRGGVLKFDDKFKDVDRTQYSSPVDYLKSLELTVNNFESYAGFYNVTYDEATRKYSLTFVIPEIQYTDQVDMDAIHGQYKSDPQLIADAARQFETKVSIDELRVDVKDGRICTIMDGSDLLMDKEYTLLSLETSGHINLHPQGYLINENVFYDNDGIYVDKEIAKNISYNTYADIYYKPKQYVDEHGNVITVVDASHTHDVFVRGYDLAEPNEDGTPKYALHVYTDPSGKQWQEILINAKKDVLGNSVFVHTPVVNDTKVISNYQEDGNSKFIGTPVSDSAPIVVLGDKFTIEIPVSGQHITAPGYNNRVYNYNGLNASHNGFASENFQGPSAVTTKYNDASPITFAKEVLIRCSFGVVYTDLSGNTTYHEPNKWFAIGVRDNGKYDFTIPEWEQELWKSGQHKVETRVIAENCPIPVSEFINDDASVKSYIDSTNKANRSLRTVQTIPNNKELTYVAEQVRELIVIGKILDFEIRATNDPDWAEVKGSVSMDSEYKLPFGQPGQNVKDTYKYGVKLGYSVYFDITTSGWYGDTSESIKLTPKYYLATKAGNVKEVDLYYKKSVNGGWVKLDSDATAYKLSTIMSTDAAKGINYKSTYINGSLKTYAIDSARELNLTTSNLVGGDPTKPEYGGRKVVNYSLPISLGNTSKIKLPYDTRLGYYRIIDELKTKLGLVDLPDRPGTNYCIGHWYGSFELPSSTIVVEKGETPTTDGSNKITEGYIIVGFDDIISESGPDDYLQYIPTDFDIKLPDGTDVNTEEFPDDEITPGIIYELISDKIDYKEGINF